MHDMPRTITSTTSRVLRLVVVYHRCGMCVCARTKSATIARMLTFFPAQQQYLPPYSHHITTQPPQSEVVVQNVPAGNRDKVSHMFVKAEGLIMIPYTWSLRRK